ncbi:TPA: restriction endonuclease subunit S [Escherichia coli]|uniref:restriction endonuclease subunit S n=2 Tax=Escherichia coli TaxID=562 RepID=UPI0010704B02|nr:restriction endonuclease subunit S [Escherichia coli]EFH9256845.1 restriction endonuclease subunit S [Escherichia coli]EGJ4352444.1 restriction endonuclease subunit S [Escherichia coli]ELM5144844.1 restriction endonuclease subunit S [Escherichia coli]QMA84828.1 restriction endonuclease subunit S [Escherichia coli]
MVYNSPLGKTKFPLAPISDGCTFISGYAFKSKDFTGIGHPVIKIKNIQDGFVILEDSQCVDSKTVEGLNKFKLNNGDILIAMTGQGSVGRVGRLTFDGKKTPYLNQRVGKFIADEKKLNISYLYYILTTQQYQNILFNNASGSGQPNLSPAVIQSTLIPYPEYHLQCEIAKILDTINNRIIKSYAINITLEQMSQTLFKSWFVDFDPVIDNALDAGNPIQETLQTRAKLRQKVRNSADFKPLPAEIRSLFPSEFEETELGWVPKGWNISLAGEEFIIKGGSTPSTANEDFWINGTIHWTSPKDLTGNQSKVLLDTAKKITPLGLTKISSGLLPVNTVLMSSRAPIGYLAISKVPMAINQGYIAIPSAKHLSPEYTIYWLDNIMDDIKGMAGGTTFAEISKSAFKTIKLLIPSSDIITEFSRITRNHFDMVVQNTKEIDSLTNLRDTLLPKLISGELSLEDLPDLSTDTEAA